MSDAERIEEEIGQLEDLLRSEGWSIFSKRVVEEWTGAGYRSRMGEALKTSDPVAPRVIHALSNEVINMLNYPKFRIQHLHEQLKRAAVKHETETTRRSRVRTPPLSARS